MLEVDPKKRINSQELVNHIWFGKERVNSSQILGNENKIMQSVFNKIYSNHYIENRFKKEILKLIVNDLTHNEVIQLRAIFKNIDVNNTGVISFQDLQKALKKLGFEDTSDQTIEKFIKSMHIEDSDNSPRSQCINYTEFLSHCLNNKNVITETKLLKIFQEFSKKKKYFTKEDLNLFLARKGRKLSKQLVNEMMNELDQNAEGKVYFQDFVRIMQGEYQDYSCKNSERNGEFKFNKGKKPTFTDYFNQQEEKENQFMKLKKIREEESQQRLNTGP